MHLVPYHGDNLDVKVEQMVRRVLRSAAYQGCIGMTLLRGEDVVCYEMGFVNWDC
jgi:hypothetical protein